MTCADYAGRLGALRAAIAAADGGPFSLADELAAVVREGGSTLAGDLLLSLSDDAHSGAMQALVHAAEALDTAPYRSHTATVLAVFPQLSGTAPDWALEVLRRIMGADAPLRELVRQLGDAPEPVKASVRAICQRNDAISPDHLPRSAKAQVARAAA